MFGRMDRPWLWRPGDVPTDRDGEEGIVSITATEAANLADDWGVTLSFGSRKAVEGVLDQLQRILNTGLDRQDRNEIYSLAYYVECQREEW